MMDNNCKYFILIDAVIILTVLEWALSKWYVSSLSIYIQVETVILLLLIVSLPFVKQKSKSSNRVKSMSERAIRIGKMIVYCFCFVAMLYFLRWLILTPFMSAAVQKTTFDVLNVLFSFFSVLIILLQLYYWRK